MMTTTGGVRCPHRWPPGKHHQPSAHIAVSEGASAHGPASALLCRESPVASGIHHQWLRTAAGGAVRARLSRQPRRLPLHGGIAREDQTTCADLAGNAVMMTGAARSVIARIDRAFIDLPEIRPGTEPYLRRSAERGWSEGAPPSESLRYVVVDVAAELYRDQVDPAVELLEFSDSAFDVLFDAAH